MMSKIYPTGSELEGRGLETTSHNSTVWTVWKKSSMGFQGTDGFSVYGGDGRLAYRVDNYTRRHKYLSGELLLMDGAGKALLTFRPQILSMHDGWIGFRSEDSMKMGSKFQVFMMRRRSIIQWNEDAEVFMGQSLTPDLLIKGCFRRRCCRIWNNVGEVIAEIKRKNVNSTIVLGDDVFSLVVEPGINYQLMIALVVIMDRILQKPFIPLMCC